jgi:uncharacterized membrane protein
MTKGRIEAFSDGVIAIIITIMVLELKVPHSPEFSDLVPLWPVFLSYLLSFIYIGIYWNNHHHLFQAVRTIRGGILWSNLHLLFWLSLIPFVTAWMGENRFAAGPTALYGCVLFGAAISYSIMVHMLLRHHESDSSLARAIGKDVKGTASMALYAISIPIALVLPILSWLIYIVTAIVWLVPDRRIERVLEPRL